MLNEWQEFLDYTGIVAYTAKSKNDISYMGRFTFTTILEFKGLARVLKIIARGYMSTCSMKSSSPARSGRCARSASSSFRTA